MTKKRRQNVKQYHTKRDARSETLDSGLKTPLYADLLVSGAIIVGMTYSLCSSTYLVPFVANNIIHLGVTYLLSYAKANKYITEDQAAIIYTAFACGSICLGFYGFAPNINNFLTNSYEYLSTAMLPYNALFNKDVSTFLLDKFSYLFHKDVLVGTTVLGIITPICLGLVNKVSSLLEFAKPEEIIKKDRVALNKKAEKEKAKEKQDEQGDSILMSTCKEVIAQYPKYLLYKSVFPNNNWAAAAGGAITYALQYGLNPRQPKTAGMYVVSALVGAYNNFAYFSLGSIQLLPMIAAATGVETLDYVLKSIGKTFVEKISTKYSGTHLKRE